MARDLLFLADDIGGAFFSVWVGGRGMSAKVGACQSMAGALSVSRALVSLVRLDGWSAVDAETDADRWMVRICRGGCDCDCD